MAPLAWQASRKRGDLPTVAGREMGREGSQTRRAHELLKRAAPRGERERGDDSDRRRNSPRVAARFLYSFT